MLASTAKAVSAATCARLSQAGGAAVAAAGCQTLAQERQDDAHDQVIDRVEEDGQSRP